MTTTWPSPGSSGRPSHRRDDCAIRTAELERLLSTARLNNLRNQLQPHFLFNALNAISAYVEEIRA
jgi:two-component system, LytTR family, sensor kinase